MFTCLLFKFLCISKLLRSFEEKFTEYLSDIWAWEFLRFKQFPGEKIMKQLIFQKVLPFLIWTPIFVPMSRYTYTQPSRGLECCWFSELNKYKTGVKIISMKITDWDIFVPCTIFVLKKETYMVPASLTTGQTDLSSNYQKVYSV